MNDSPHALYRFYDHDGQLLYIGITMNPTSRFQQHRHDKPWWVDIAEIRLEPFPTRQAVLDAERAAIIAEKPSHNVVHNGESPSKYTRSEGSRCAACNCILGTRSDIYLIGGDKGFLACQTCGMNSSSTDLHRLAYPTCKEFWHDIWDHGMTIRGRLDQIQVFLTSAQMPDDCHDICAKDEIYGMYYPYTWGNGRAFYQCRQGHEWECGWGNGTAGQVPTNRGMNYGPYGGTPNNEWHLAVSL